MSNKIILHILLVASVLGIADTAYLTADHYFGSGVRCLLVEGCDVVLTSRYSEFLNIPVALFGLVFYFTVFFLVNLIELRRTPVLLKLLTAVSAAGLVVSLVFLYLQVFTLKAYCFYCLTSLTTSAVIFIFSAWITKRGLDGTIEEGSRL